MRVPSLKRVAGFALCLVLASPLVALAGDDKPDLALSCKKKVKNQLNLDEKKDIKILGKRTNSDGFIVLDFAVFDGRKGSCFLYKNGKVAEVKVQQTAPGPAAHGRK
jgi:hypothetical protein